MATTVIDTALAKSLLPKREPNAHKWGIGGVLVIAGSPMFTGAAWLATRGAGRAGAGVVRLASGRSVIATLAGFLPEVAHVILPESDTASGAKHTLDLITENVERMKAVVIGPGIGDDDASNALLNVVFGFGKTLGKGRPNIGFGYRARLLSAGTGEGAEEEPASAAPLFGDGSVPVVIDADGLNWLAKQEEWWTRLPEGKAVLTPHVGEFSRLTGLETDEILKDPQKHAEAYAKTWKQTVVLKAGRTLVTDGRTTYIAEAETAALATAGSGDVFSGTIGALLAQGLGPLEAAALAIHLGAIAGAQVAQEFGDLGVIAPDLPDAIARALRSLAA